MTPQDNAVMQLSVYNALSLTGQDMTPAQVTAFLSLHWNPAQSRNAKRVSCDAVEVAAAELSNSGHITRDGDCLRIVARDPMTRRGQTLNIDYVRGVIVKGEAVWAA